MSGPYDPTAGTVAVMAGRCATCVFRPGNLMRLAPGRLAEIVRANVEADSALACHETTYGQAPREAVCRGFYDAHPTLPLRLAAALGMVVEVDPALSPTGAKGVHSPPAGSSDRLGQGERP